MNNKYFIITTLVLFIFSGACKKNEPGFESLASLNVINAVVNGPVLKLNNSSNLILNKSIQSFGLFTGSSMIYVYPVADSLRPYYNNSLQVNNGDIYTLFISGSASAVDTFLIKENIPYRPDNSLGVRFINLAPNSGPVNITLSDSPTTNEFSNVGYKNITEFKSFPADNSVTSYSFQIRDAGTNAIISTIAMTGTAVANGLPRHQNVTLILTGLVGGNPSAAILRINHFIR